MALKGNKLALIVLVLGILGSVVYSRNSPFEPLEVTPKSDLKELVNKITKWNPQKNECEKGTLIGEALAEFLFAFEVTYEQEFKNYVEDIKQWRPKAKELGVDAKCFYKAYREYERIESHHKAKYLQILKEDYRYLMEDAKRLRKAANDLFKKAETKENKKKEASEKKKKEASEKKSEEPPVEVLKIRLQMLDQLNKASMVKIAGHCLKGHVDRRMVHVERSMIKDNAFRIKKIKSILKSTADKPKVSLARARDPLAQISKDPATTKESTVAKESTGAKDPVTAKESTKAEDHSSAKDLTAAKDHASAKDSTKEEKPESEEESETEEKESETEEEPETEQEEEESSHAMLARGKLRSPPVPKFKSSSSFKRRRRRHNHAHDYSGPSFALGNVDKFWDI